MHLTVKEARQRLQSGKKVFASYWDREQRCPQISGIIDRGYGYCSLVLADESVTPSMAYDRVAFVSTPL